MQDVIEKLSGMEEDDMEEMDEALIQQIQLFNVALKQEDGEPVTESEISFLGEPNEYNAYLKTFTVHKQNLAHLRGITILVLRFVHLQY